MANWFGKGKRGLIMGVWNAHTSVGEPWQHGRCRIAVRPLVGGLQPTHSLPCLCIPSSSCAVGLTLWPATPGRVPLQATSWAA